VATSGLAVTLAYLALDRFRYRSAIEGAARKCYEKFLADSEIPKETKLGVWNEVLWLVRESPNTHKPAGFWGGVYKALFRRHVDFLLVTVLALLSGAALSVGVARHLDTWSWLAWADRPAAALVFFYVCIIATAFPFLSMYGGHRCTRWGVERACYCDEQLLIYQNLQATEVRAPVANGGEAAA
jgi:hypothetical protein